MRSDEAWERAPAVTIWLIILIILSILVSIAYCNYRQPRIIKDYHSFAIVEMAGERYVWVKDVYGEGLYWAGEETIENIERRSDSSSDLGESRSDEP